MSFRRPRFQEEEEAQAINISPLIDVIFILLIFFIVTMEFADSAAMKIDAPKSSQTEAADPDAPVVVIDADSNFILDSARLDASGLRVALARRLSGGGAGAVVLRADSRVPVDRLVEAMECAKSAGAQAIYVSTDKK